MFLFPTKTIIEETHISVASVADVVPYIPGTIGDQSNKVVNRLFSSSLEEHDIFGRKTSIISRFAGVMLAIKAGPNLIRHLAQATRHDGNPTMDGWMFEMWFFASLCHGGVKCAKKFFELGQNPMSELWISIFFLLCPQITEFGLSQASGVRVDLTPSLLIKEKDWLNSFN
jgi:hypothetical protein